MAYRSSISSGVSVLVEGGEVRLRRIDRQGLAQAAESGTLFLDEVGELSLNAQARLLRFLDFKEVRPVGSTQSRSVDIRIVTATNRDLAQLVEQKQFRQDLYYRLRVIQLQVPSLRERREDLPLLILHFVKQFAAREHKRIPGLAEHAMDLLLARRWSGNVRELKHEIERAVALTAAGEKIGVASLSPEVRGSVNAVHAQTFLADAREQAERRAIEAALRDSGWNVSSAARTLGISRVGLTKKLKRMGIVRPLIVDRH